MTKLNDIYIDNLRFYNETGLKPYLDEMLLILLLEEKEYFEPLKLTVRDFYKFYQRFINEKINKIRLDFNLTEENIIEQKQQKGFKPDEDIYFLIENILEIILETVKKCPIIRNEEIYYQYYYLSDESNKNNNKIKKEPKKTLSKILKRNKGD